MRSRRLKLGQRLALSYGLVIMLLILVSLSGLSMLSELQKNTSSALKDRYAKTQLVNEVINDLESIARAMRNTLFLNDAQQIREQLQDINTAKFSMAQSLAHLKDSIHDAEGKEILHEIDVIHSAYIVNQEDFVELVTDQHMGEAKNLLLVDLHPYQIQYFNALRKLNRLQSASMAEASEKIATSYLSARQWMLALAATAVVLSIIVTVWLTRSLLRQLGGEPDYATAIARRIAEGDLLSEIRLNKGDESSLLYVMRTMRDSLIERTETLEMTNMELEATVDTLKRTQNELVASEKMAALGSLVAGVAHELNTPIGNSVMMASSLVDMTESLSEDARANTLKRSNLDKYISEVKQGSEILLRNLRRSSELVLSFKQVAVDRETSQARHFLLSDIVQEIVLMMQPIFKKTRFELSIDISPLIAMDSYPGPLGQVISNLINNVLVHGFEERTEGHIHISARVEGNSSVLLAVEDDGCGITPENLPRIFDPFFTTKLGRGGSGLGLHIVYNIVHSILQGTIHVNSKPGVGTRFELLLPLSCIQ
ncbi:ATP-binding protein [Undibacterium sp. TS12]|uniref:ATP-binding protein n=1 Tax=Undibacterium sp. TS12 TaxID=2908202 RepID=UPI001F4C6208|nr:ATP-binding protein [Undibacterium sp. TS12]MCH8621081.1 ATP-binding protein [Undibacterium sp. TS12]